MSSMLFLTVPSTLRAKSPEVTKETLNRLDVEIIEVEELKEPHGSAIYMVKDLSSGETLRLYADPYRSLIQVGGKPHSAGDALGGSKATIICRKSQDQELAEIIFAKITSSYYS